MSYNLTLISDNATTMLGFTRAVNNVLLDGYLGLLFLVGVFIILIIAFNRVTDNAPKSFSAASFIVAVLCLVLRVAGLTSDKIFFGTVVLCAATIATTWNR